MIKAVHVMEYVQMKEAVNHLKSVTRDITTMFGSISCSNKVASVPSFSKVHAVAHHSRALIAWAELSSTIE
jgi:hypothetical protein